METENTNLNKSDNRIDWATCEPIKYNSDVCMLDMYELHYSGLSKIVNPAYDTILYAFNTLSYEEIKHYLSINGLMLDFVQNKTSELCEIAVENNPEAFKYVGEFETDDMALKAVRKYPHMLEHVRNQTDCIIKIAIDDYPDAVKYVKEQTPEICEYAIKCGALLDSLKEPSQRLIAIGCTLKAMNIQYVLRMGLNKFKLEEKN